MSEDIKQVLTQMLLLTDHEFDTDLENQESMHEMDKRLHIPCDIEQEIT